jgi:hypothetical protein
VRIVVCGTHATGKSTLVSDFALAHPGYEVLPDPFELVDEVDPGSAESFHEQLVVASERLRALPATADVIAERGPLDFLAYLAALTSSGRVSGGLEASESLRAATASAMAHVDLLVVLPLDGTRGVWVPDEEDPRLRAAMDAHLLDLCDDEELVGDVGRVVELSGPPEDRLATLSTLVSS